MKRFAFFSFLGLCLLALLLSCGRDRQHNRFSGFQQDARDTVLIDFGDTLYPASSLTLDRLLKSGGYYFLSFQERYRIPWNRYRRIIVALSDDNMSSRPVPQPPAGNLAVRNGHLIAKDSYDGVLSVFDTESWSWGEGRIDQDAVVTLHEDDDWIMRYSDHGEFGYICWFIDKHSPSDSPLTKAFIKAAKDAPKWTPASKDGAHCKVVIDNPLHIDYRLPATNKYKVRA